MKKNKLKTDKMSIGVVLIYIFMALMCLITLYPFLYVTAYSFSNAKAVIINTVTIFPIEPTLNNFKVVFSNPMIYNSMMITVLRTLIGTVYTHLVTGLASYSISKQYPGKRLLTIFLIIPM